MCELSGLKFVSHLVEVRLISSQLYKSASVPVILKILCEFGTENLKQFLDNVCLPRSVVSHLQRASVMSCTHILVKKLIFMYPNLRLHKSILVKLLEKIPPSKIRHVIRIRKNGSGFCLEMLEMQCCSQNCQIDFYHP